MELVPAAEVADPFPEEERREAYGAAVVVLFVILEVVDVRQFESFRFHFQRPGAWGESVAGRIQRPLPIDVDV